MNPSKSGTMPAPLQNYIRPFIFMVILMALIGFVTGMNQQFQEPLKHTFLAEAGNAKNTLSILLVFSFFLAYLLMGPTASTFLNKKGYKRTLLLGIALVAGAMAIFELSVLIYGWAGGSEAEGVNKLNLFGTTLPLSFFIFLFGSFLSGTGLTFLQASVNPYIVVCTVPHTTGVTRQNIAGVGNSVMTTFTPLFVAYVIFGGKAAETISVDAMVMPFVVLFVLLLFLLGGVSSIKLPHLEGTTEQSKVKLRQTVLRYRHLVLGTIALGVYVGCEVCIGANIINAWVDAFKLGHAGASEAEVKAIYHTAALWSTIYWGCMLVGRFLSSFLSKVPAQKQLMFATILSAAFIILAIVVGDLRILVAVGLTHSVIWGAVFSLAINGLGKYTALGSGVLLMGVVGGAILPLLQGIWADTAGSWKWTWLLVIAGEIYMLYYALRGHKVVVPKGLE